MSDARRKRQEDRERKGQPKALPWRAAGIGLLVVLVFGGVYYLATRHRTGRLDTFAQCLSSKGVKMYGAYWCPHCEEQKELFGSSFDHGLYIECGIKGSRAEQKGCLHPG